MATGNWGTYVLKILFMLGFILAIIGGVSFFFLFGGWWTFLGIFTIPIFSLGLLYWILHERKWGM